MKTLLILLALAASVHAQGFNQCKPSPDKATVYFYRVSEKNGMRKDQTKVSINDSKGALEIPKGSYVGLYLAPGRHTLTMGRRETDFLLNAEAGHVYFFRVSNIGVGFSELRALTSISEDQATFQMKDMKPLSHDNVKSQQLERCNSL